MGELGGLEVLTGTTTETRDPRANGGTAQLSRWWITRMEAVPERLVALEQAQGQQEVVGLSRWTTSSWRLGLRVPEGPMREAIRSLSSPVDIVAMVDLSSRSTPALSQRA